jgi:hypothetical protein
MKPLIVFLGLSLVANVMLAVLITRVSAANATATANPRPTAGGTSPQAASATASSSAPNAKQTAARGSPWSDLNSENLEILVARLRAAGFPDRVLRAVVNRLLDDRFRVREHEITRGEEDIPFWREPSRVFDRPEYRTAMNKLHREREALAKKLLGADYRARDDETRLSYQRAWGNLPPEKLSALMEIFEQEAELRDSLLQSGRAISNENSEKLIALDQRQRKAAEQLLTAEELEQYDRRASVTASMLRYSSLQSFQASEEEFLALYRLFRPLEDQFAWRYREATREETAFRQRLEDSLQPQIKAALGPERYADYLHAKTPEHGQLNRLVARLELPLSAARTVVTVQEETTKRADAVRDNTTLTPAQRSAQLASLTEEASARIAAILGARGLTAYKSYGGQWLTSLAGSRPPVK